MDALDTFVSSMFTTERWPFWSVALIFAIVGNFTAQHLFTRERAYLKRRLQPFWWWGRESLSIHPIVAGLLLGRFWVDPETRKWSMIASSMYFAAAGAVSLVLWMLLKGAAKKKGIDLTLPGDSSIPPPKSS